MARGGRRPPARCCCCPGSGGSGGRGGRAAGVPALVLVLHPLGMALLAPYRGPGFQEGRYSIHLLPLAVAVAAGRGRRARSVEARCAPRCAGRLLARRALALPSGRDALRAGRCRTSTRCRCISAAGSPRTRRPTARLALNDIGAIAYVSRREVVDLMGLVTPAILAVPPGRRARRAALPRARLSRLPDRSSRRGFRCSSAMADRFRPIYRVTLARNEVAGADEMVVYETAWSRAARLPDDWLARGRGAVMMPVMKRPVRRGGSSIATVGARRRSPAGRSRRRGADLPLDRRAGQHALLPGHRERAAALPRRGGDHRLRATPPPRPRRAGRSTGAASGVGPRPVHAGPAHHGVGPRSTARRPRTLMLDTGADAHADQPDACWPRSGVELSRRPCAAPSGA